jgi:hypothetical protein
MRSGLSLLALLAGVFLSCIALSVAAPDEDKADTKKADAKPKPKKVEKPATEPKALPLEEAYTKARGNGKYAMLLGQIKVERDHGTFKDFAEAGLIQRREGRYAGYNNLPAGYWVYVYPYWYIWRDLTAIPTPKQGWGPEQATGAPDTPASGDFGTAWASLTPDAQNEWLLLEYDEPIQPKAIRIHENWNPGAVRRISAFDLKGEEVDVWSGEDPTAQDKEKGVSVIPLKVGFKTARVRIFLASKEVEGWNEIDAVGMDDASGKTHWASAAIASSTNAAPNERALFTAFIFSEQRIRRLELEVLKLREALAERDKKKAE